MIGTETIDELRDLNRSNGLDMDGKSWAAMCNALGCSDDPDTQARLLRRLGIADVATLRHTMADAMVARMKAMMALVRTLREG